MIALASTSASGSYCIAEHSSQHWVSADEDGGSGYVRSIPSRGAPRRRTELASSPTSRTASPLTRNTGLAAEDWQGTRKHGLEGWSLLPEDFASAYRLSFGNTTVITWHRGLGRNSLPPLSSLPIKLLVNKYGSQPRLAEQYRVYDCRLPAHYIPWSMIWMLNAHLPFIRLGSGV